MSTEAAGDLAPWLPPRVAWVVLAVAPGGELPPGARDLVHDRSPADLPFDATDHLQTTGGPGIHLAAWFDAAGSVARTPALPWWRNGDRTTVLTGRWRRFGDRWQPLGRAAEAFATALDASSPERLPVDSVGSYTAVDLRPGRAVIVPDALGHGFAYVGGDRHLQVAASRPELVARALAVAAEPERDLLNAANLAFAPFPFGEATGFVGVRLLRPGATATLTRGRLTVVERDPHDLAAAVVGERPARPEDLTDIVVEAVVDELLAAAALPCSQPTIDLTGGKDSRALLGCALEAGLADRFTFRTAGPPELVDVQIAAELAARFGLRHESGLFGHAPGTPFDQRTRRFVRATSGSVNGWFAKVPRHGTPELRISGISGECLRAHHPIRGRHLDLAELAPHLASRFRAGALPLLHPEAGGLLDALLADELTRGTSSGMHPLDALAAFNVGNRARLARGPMDELEGDVRITPLATPRTVGAAMALDPLLRQDEYLHHRITARADPALAAHRFASDGWPEGLAAHVPSDGAPGTPATRSPAPVAKAAPNDGDGDEASAARHVPTDRRSGTSADAHDGALVAGGSAGGKAESLSARIHRSRGTERSSFLREVFADPANPMWAMVDREVALAAAEDFDRLTVKQRRQVFGAATAVLWADGAGLRR